MKIHTFLLLVLAFTCITFSMVRAESGRDTLNAASILNKSEESYAALKIYLDSGKVISDFYKGTSPHKTAIYFKTAFSEDGSFNFEYYEPGKSNSLFTINRTEKKVQSWWGVDNKIITDRTLSRSLAAAAGVSSRTSTIIPGLLSLEDFNGKKSIYKSFTPVLTRSESIKGIECYKITGKGSMNEDLIFWIAKKDFLIRKIETNRKIDTKLSRVVADSFLEKKFISDSASLKKRSDLETNSQKKAVLLNQLDSLVKARTKHKNLMNMMSALPRPETFFVKATYEYYPYTLKVVDKKLFRFRPNREVAL